MRLDAVAGSAQFGPLVLFDTAAAEVGKIAALAAGQRVAQGDRPHQQLATPIGSLTLGAYPVKGIQSGVRLAADVADTVAMYSGSTTGAAGIPPAKSAIPGLANIHEGIALLSGIK